MPSLLKTEEMTDFQFRARVNFGFGLVAYALCEEWRYTRSVQGLKLVEAVTCMHLFPQRALEGTSQT
jgi:hypothetical protein